MRLAPMRYLTSRRKALRACQFGREKHRKSSFVAKAISGRSRAKQLALAAIALKSVASSAERMSCACLDFSISFAFLTPIRFFWNLCLLMAAKVSVVDRSHAAPSERDREREYRRMSDRVLPGTDRRDMFCFTNRISSCGSPVHL